MQSPALFESRHVFSSKVFQMHRNRTFRSTVDIIPIRFRRYDAYANYNPETHRYDDEFPILKRIRTLKLKFSREKASGDAKTRMERFARYRRIIAGSPREANKLRNKLGRYLSTVMSLPEDKHYILSDCFQVSGISI
uniref:uncharacterized protein LOC101305131 n=1 Tax=Fragaria vesca subsp. vesca TaxID=101020 RepID=UPI0005CB02E9|nr:PREDICTED: uncharacterized protein LOC101305131 [Fragaria vesca subsp. vesca]